MRGASVSRSYQNTTDESDFEDRRNDVEYQGRENKANASGRRSSIRRCVKSVSYFVPRSMALDKAPVCLPRWKLKSRFWMCEKTFFANSRMLRWATLAKIALRSSPKRAAPALAAPSNMNEKHSSFPHADPSRSHIRWAMPWSWRWSLIVLYRHGVFDLYSAHRRDVWTWMAHWCSVISRSTVTPRRARHGSSLVCRFSARWNRTLLWRCICPRPCRRARVHSLLLHCCYSHPEHWIDAKCTRNLFPSISYNRE